MRRCASRPPVFARDLQETSASPRDSNGHDTIGMWQISIFATHVRATNFRFDPPANSTRAGFLGLSKPSPHTCLFPLFYQVEIRYRQFLWKPTSRPLTSRDVPESTMRLWQTHGFSRLHHLITNKLITIRFLRTNRTRRIPIRSAR